MRPPTSGLTLGQSLFLFAAISILLAEITVDRIPVIDTPRIFIRTGGDAYAELKMPPDRTAWYAPTAHEVGLVRDSMDAVVRRGLFHSGGFPVYQGLPYFSTAGIYNLAWGIFAPKKTAKLAVYYEFMERWLALAAGLLTAFFIVGAAHRFGIAAAAAVFIASATCVYQIQFSRSIYWHWAFALAPSVFTWTFYERLTERGQLAKLFAGIAALVFLKALLGYEYITNIVAAAAAPVVYFESIRKSSWRKIVARVLIIGAAGVAGFLPAVAIQISMLFHSVGSLSSAVEIFYTRASIRTMGAPNIPSAWREGTSRWAIVLDAARSDMFIFHPLTRGLVRLNTLTFAKLWGGVVALYGALTICRLGKRDRALESLFLTTVVAAGASLTWPLFAKAHLLPHAHLTPIIFTLPFIPIASLAIGRFAGWVVGDGAGLFGRSKATPREAPAEAE